MVLVNIDPPGQGLNDPTPAAPVGGNPGTTLGEQRSIVFQVAADLWGSTLDSAAPIFVLATFTPLPCDAGSGVLGSAGPTFVFNNFPPGPPDVLDDTWYHSALADQLAGFDLNPGFGDIVAFFNADLDNNPDCLAGTNWYYGLDGNSGTDIDFLPVVTHEIGHGLGVSDFVDLDTGELLAGLQDIYTVFTFDNTTGLHWNEMTDAERLASAVNDGNLVWDGESVQNKAPSVLGARPFVKVLLPHRAAGRYPAQAATFGPLLEAPGITRRVVLADDGTATATDACEPLVNGHQVRHRIALVDRGGCTFNVKALNAQAAGAVGMIVANNQPDGPAPMGGFDPAVTIPSVGVTQAAGDAFKDALPALFVNLGADRDLLIGADDDGRPLLYAPPVIAPGSSIAHWDVSAIPNLLMEPFINPDLDVLSSLDLTPFLLEDVGWALTDTDGDGFADVCDACQASDLGATVVIDGCDSGVANPVLGEGCSVADQLGECAAEAGNHGQYVACVALKTLKLVLEGTIDFGDQAKILVCAARSGLP